MRSPAVTSDSNWSRRARAKCRVVDEHAALDVPLLRGLGEVGRRDEGPGCRRPRCTWRAGRPWGRVRPRGPAGRRTAPGGARRRANPRPRTARRRPGRSCASLTLAAPGRPRDVHEDAHRQVRNGLHPLGQHREDLGALVDRVGRDEHGSLGRSEAAPRRRRSCRGCPAPGVSGPVQTSSGRAATCSSRSATSRSIPHARPAAEALPTRPASTSAVSSGRDRRGPTLASAAGVTGACRRPSRSASARARSVAVGRSWKTERTPYSRKNSAPAASTVGTTSARSRNSLRRSHEGSAISRQPWQAAPLRKRSSCGSFGQCCAQTGSFEHRRASSRAASQVLVDAAARPARARRACPRRPACPCRAGSRSRSRRRRSARGSSWRSSRTRARRR